MNYNQFYREQDIKSLTPTQQENFLKQLNEIQNLYKNVTSADGFNNQSDIDNEIKLEVEKLLKGYEDQNIENYNDSTLYDGYISNNNDKSQDLLLNSLYNQYLNENSKVNRNQFLQNYKNRYNEDFLDYLRRNKKDINSLDDIIRYENSSIDDLLDEQYTDDGSEWWR